MKGIYGMSYNSDERKHVRTIFPLTLRKQTQLVALNSTCAWNNHSNIFIFKLRLKPTHSFIKLR